MRLPFDTSKSLRDFNPIAVGLVSLGLIGAVVGMTIAVGLGGLLQSTYTMSGVFPDSSGLGNGNPVRVAGVVVGQVTGIHPDRQHGDVVVTWKVNKGVNVGHSATATVKLATLLGGDYISLGGPVDQPYMASLPADQRRIPMSRTSEPYQVLGVLGTATHTIQQIDVGAIDRLVNDFADISQGQQVPTSDILNGFDQVAGALNARTAQLQSLETQSQKLTDALAQKDAALGQLIDSSATLLNLVAQRRNELAQILGNGSQAVTAFDQLLTTKQNQLDALLNNLHVGLEAIHRQQPNVDKGLGWLGPTFTATAQIGSHGPFLDGFILGGANPTQMFTSGAGAPTP